MTRTVGVEKAKLGFDIEQEADIYRKKRAEREKRRRRRKKEGDKEQKPNRYSQQKKMRKVKAVDNGLCNQRATASE